MMKSLGKIGAAFSCLTLMVLAGCGYKNAPVPPETVVPEAVSDLHYTIDPKGVVLDWSYPVETINGTKIGDIKSFELYRAEIPLNELCGNCPVPYGEPIEVAGGMVYDAMKRRTASYSDSFLKPQHKYFFKVRSRLSWWASSDDSNVVSFIWFTPAEAPENVRSSAGDGQIRISWSPVTRLIDGAAPQLPVRYQLQRSVAGKPFQNVGKPSAVTSYLDRQVVLGQKYFYRVQSVLEYKGQYSRGGISENILAVPVDLSPPPAPVNLVATRMNSGIKLYWQQVNSDDLKGYRVYRRLASETKLSLIAELAGNEAGYVDTDAASNVRYYYAVTAIDWAKPANESDFSIEVTPRYN